MGSRRTFGFSLLASALRSFARAIFCNCRIRSLVTPNFFPISSRISGLPPSNPNRIEIILRSRSSNTSKSSLTKFVAHVPVSERLERRLRIFITDDLAKFG